MKEFVCIVCPNGCQLKIDEKTLQVSGNKCASGEKFAKQEITAPKRMLCTTAKTIFDDVPVIAVKLTSEIAKAEIFNVMKEINKVVIKERLKTNSVVIRNVCNLHVDVVVASNCLVNNE